jgi:hypothetical protein
MSGRLADSYLSSGTVFDPKRVSADCCLLLSKRTFK